MMEAIEPSVASHLKAALTELLSHLPGGTMPSLMVVPSRIRHAGVGGLIREQNDPAGETIGWRLDATASVTATAASTDALDEILDGITMAFVNAGRQRFSEIELLKVSLKSDNAAGCRTEDNGIFRQTIAFELCCEVQKSKGPVEPGGIIETIPTHIKNVGENVEP
jgi:hypothetical protein